MGVATKGSLGVLGGTFDPIHVGHLIMAEEARVRLGLERVLCMPAGQPWMRARMGVTAVHHRVEMVRRATRSNGSLCLSTMEVERPGDTYTVDTVRALRERLGGEVPLYFVLGADSLAQLPRWKEPRELLRLCRLVVMARAGYGGGLVERMDRELPGLKEATVWLKGPQVGVSSTEIRRRVGRGLSIRYWVPAEVEQYIWREGLYREAR